MVQTRIAVEKEIRDRSESGWSLAFQKVTYIYPPGKPSEKGFRFIWYRPDNTLQAARGQARIPTLAQAKSMIDRAIAEGWETVPERVANFVTEQWGKPYCDGCIAKALELPRPQQAQQATTGMAAGGEFTREKGTCTDCGKQVTVTSRRPSHAPDDEEFSD